MPTVNQSEMEQRNELLLENLIRIQGTLNAKLDYISRRLSQVEYTLQQPPHQESPISNR
jgi:hypothetical protein